MEDFKTFLKTPIGKFFIVWATVSVAVVAYGIIK